MASFLEESIIEYPPYRFLITKVPSDSIMPDYIKLLKANNVQTVIRACEPSYNAEILQREGIAVHVSIYHNFVIF
jgi:protein tyrosine phosphatase type 4A